MRKLLSLGEICLLLLFSSCFANAQSYHLGLRTGYIQSQINSENEANPELSSRHAFHISLVHTYKPQSSKIGFSVETAYMLKGVRIDDPDLDYRLHYASMPVLLDLYPTERLRLSIGPEIGYLLDARNRLTDSTSATLEDVFTNRWELSGTIGATYSLNFFTDVGVRYSLGLTDIADMDAVLDRRKLKTSSLQFFFYFKIAN